MPNYILIQLVSYALNMGIFIVLNSFSFLNPVVSNILGKSLSSIFSFIGHRQITFRLQSEKYKHTQFFRYFILLISNVFVASVLLSFSLLFVDNVILAKFGIDVILFFLNFWIGKKWIFI